MGNTSHKAIVAKVFCRQHWLVSCDHGWALRGNLFYLSPWFSTRLSVCCVYEWGTAMVGLNVALEWGGVPVSNGWQKPQRILKVIFTVTTSSGIRTLDLLLGRRMFYHFVALYQRVALQVNCNNAASPVVSSRRLYIDWHQDNALATEGNVCKLFAVWVTKRYKSRLCRHKVICQPRSKTPCRHNSRDAYYINVMAHC